MLTEATPSPVVFEPVNQSAMAETRVRNEVHRLAQKYYNALAMPGNAPGADTTQALAANASVDINARSLSAVLPKDEDAGSLKQKCQGSKTLHLSLLQRIQKHVNSVQEQDDKNSILEAIVGKDSPAGKSQPLQTAMRRKDLKNFLPSDADTQKALKELEDKATAKVLEDATHRTAFFGLSKGQQDLLKEMAGQESAKDHLPAFAALSVAMSQSSDEATRTAGHELCTKLMPHLQPCLDAGDTASMTETASILASSPSLELAKTGNEIAHALVTSGKLEEKALLELNAQPLKELLSLREFAEKHAVGTSNHCMTKVLGASGKLLKKVKENPAEKEEDQQERLDSIHLLLLNAHANGLLTGHSSIDNAHKAAVTAMADNSKQAVECLLSTLAHDNRERPVKLSAKIVSSPEFMTAFGTQVATPPSEPVKGEGAADAMDVVPKPLTTYQPNMETASAQKMVAQAELYLSRTNRDALIPSISPDQLHKAAKIFENEGDTQEVLSCLDMLCKYHEAGIPSAREHAVQLFADIWKQRTDKYKELAKTDAAPDVDVTNLRTRANWLEVEETREGTTQSVPKPGWLKVDREDVDTPDAWGATDQLIEIAALARTMQAYSDTVLPEITAIQKVTDAAFTNALDRMDYSAAVQLASVHEALLPPKVAAVGYQQMAGQLLAKSRDHLAGDDCENAMVSAQACLEIASRDRRVLEHVFEDVAKLRLDIAKTLDPGIVTSAAESDADFGHKVLVAGSAKALSDCTAANNLNDAFRKAEHTRTTLNEITGKLSSVHKHNTDRFKGALNTGCPDVLTYRYTSKAEAGDGDHEATLALAHAASAAVQSAYNDFCKADFSRWDADQTQLRRVGQLQMHWKKATEELPDVGSLSTGELEQARQALVFDLNHINQLKVPHKDSDEPYITEMRNTWKQCRGDTEAFIKARAVMHGKTPLGEITQKYAKGVVDLLRVQAGSLLEERMYQLLPNQTRLQWDKQDKTLFPMRKEGTKKTGGSRPDIVQTFDGKHNVCLDLTAQGSAGHIFGKTDAWVHQKVTEAIEITYPSISKDVLKKSMLLGVSVDPEAIRAADRKAAETKRLKQNTQKLYQDCANLGDAEAWREKLKAEMPEEAVHLAKWADFQDAKKFGNLEGPADEGYVQSALAKLDMLVKNLARQNHADGKTLPPSLASSMNAEGQRLHEKLRTVDELEKLLRDYDTANTGRQTRRKGAAINHGLAELHTKLIAAGYSPTKSDIQSCRTEVAKARADVNRSRHEFDLASQHKRKEAPGASPDYKKQKVAKGGMHP